MGWVGFGRIGLNLNLARGEYVGFGNSVEVLHVPTMVQTELAVAVASARQPWLLWQESLGGGAYSFVACLKSFDHCPRIPFETEGGLSYGMRMHARNSG